jgi:hypothetical protein
MKNIFNKRVLAGLLILFVGVSGFSLSGCGEQPRSPTINTPSDQKNSNPYGEDYSGQMMSEDDALAIMQKNVDDAYRRARDNEGEESGFVEDAYLIVPSDTTIQGLSDLFNQGTFTSVDELYDKVTSNVVLLTQTEVKHFKEWQILEVIDNNDDKIDQDTKIADLDDLANKGTSFMDLADPDSQIRDHFIQFIVRMDKAQKRDNQNKPPLAQTLSNS